MLYGEVSNAQETLRLPDTELRLYQVDPGLKERSQKAKMRVTPQ